MQTAAFQEILLPDEVFPGSTCIDSLIVLISELGHIDATQTDADWIKFVTSNVNLGVRLIPVGHCVLFLIFHLLVSLGRQCLSFTPIQERGSERRPYRLWVCCYLVFPCIQALTPTRTCNLRVVDLSIMPLLFSAHTQPLAYAVGEKAADIIKSGN